MWVQRELENREEDDDDYRCTTVITHNVSSDNSHNEVDEDDCDENDYDFYQINTLKVEMQVKFDFLKRYSDGKESDYEIAKFVLSTM